MNTPLKCCSAIWIRFWNSWKVLKEAIAYSESVRDYVTRELLEDIQEYEEEYLDWLETQQTLISQLGIENYQQSMM